MASISSCTAAAPPPEMVPVSPTVLFFPRESAVAALLPQDHSLQPVSNAAHEDTSCKHWTHVLCDITGAPTCVFSLSVSAGGCVCVWAYASCYHGELQHQLCSSLCSVNAGVSDSSSVCFCGEKAHLSLCPHCDFQFMIIYTHSPWFTPKAKSQTRLEVNGSN